MIVAIITHIVMATRRVDSDMMRVAIMRIGSWRGCCIRRADAKKR